LVQEDEETGRKGEEMILPERNNFARGARRRVERRKKYVGDKISVRGVERKRRW